MAKVGKSCLAKRGKVTWLFQMVRLQLNWATEPLIVTRPIMGTIPFFSLLPFT